MTTSPFTRFCSYFLALGLTTVLCLAGVVAFNYLVDPYYTHQWDTVLLKRPSPPQQKIVPWAKTFAASRYRPEVVLLGSSRSEIGLPAQTDRILERAATTHAASLSRAPASAPAPS